LSTSSVDLVGVIEVELFIVALAGFVAAMVDGALGMGFGPTSSSILLSTGLSPAAVSTTVNLAKVATGAVAGVAHWRFRNIDRRLVLQLAIPGCIGALVGVTVLNNVDGDQLKPILAVILILVGLRILVRFSRPLRVAVRAAANGDTTGDPDSGTAPEFDERGVLLAAGTGGVTNGLVGAWGPVVTPFLLHKGLAPRFAIGSVNTAEVAVATVSAGTLIASIGNDGMDVGIAVAMLAGGVLAAPLAAMVVRHLPPRALGVAVACLLLTTNARELAGWADLGPIRFLAYGSIGLFVAAASLRPRLQRTRTTPERTQPDKTTLTEPSLTEPSLTEPSLTEPSVAENVVKMTQTAHQRGLDVV
jgi:uncharacterized protein